MKKNVIVIGENEKVKSLVTSLIDKGYSVSLISGDINFCKRLTNIFKLNVYCGDGTDISLLKSINLSNKDIIVAATSRDEVNLSICIICKKIFNVSKTISILSDINKTEFFYKMGVDNVVCEISLIANYVEQQSIFDKIAKIIPFSEGKVQIAEIKIFKDSPSIDKKIWELILPSESIIGCIIRGENVIIPRGETRILENDKIIIIARNGNESRAIEALTGRKNYD